MTGHKVLVAGAGIGGLTAALALAQRGHRVELCEQAAVLSEIGAGLQLSPNAVRCLQELGLGEALREIAFVPQQLVTRDWRHGRCLVREPLGEAAVTRWGAPYYHVHRADLQQLLLSEVRLHPAIHLHLKRRVQAVTLGAQSVALHTADGNVAEAEVLVGADGIHSAVRTALFGAEEPRYTGHVAWRFVIPTADFPQLSIEPAATLWMGPGAHFVHYYLRGGDWINCVCVVEQSDWCSESWTELGDKQSLLGAFAGWHDNIQQLLQAAPPAACYRWALLDREPMSVWAEGHATLLGDACHPTLPFLAQGAAMAIEDADALARCLVTRDIPTALLRYQKLRYRRTARVQAQSRRNGRIYHLRGLAALARNLALRLRLVSPSRSMAWLFEA